LGIPRYIRYSELAVGGCQNTSPRECASYIVKAFRFLTQFGQANAA